MTANEPSLFRIMAWPDGEVAVPAAHAVGAELMSGGGTLRYFLEGEWRRADPLPPEFAIREVPSLDADDPEVLLHITKTWGPLTFPVLTGSLIPQSDAWNSRDRQDSIRLRPPRPVALPPRGGEPP